MGPSWRGTRCETIVPTSPRAPRGSYEARSLGRRLAQLGGVNELDEVQVARLCVFAALHDLGKFDQHFQNKGRPGAQPRAGHVREFAVILDDEARGPARTRLEAVIPFDAMRCWGASDDTTQQLLCASGRPSRAARAVHGQRHRRRARSVGGCEGPRPLRGDARARRGHATVVSAGVERWGRAAAEERRVRARLQRARDARRLARVEPRVLSLRHVARRPHRVRASRRGRCAARDAPRR